MSFITALHRSLAPFSIMLKLKGITYMRKVSLLAAVLMLALLTGSALAFPRPASADGLEDIISIDIVFDGYCDGMHLDIDQETRVVTAMRTGSCIPPSPLSGRVRQGQARMVDDTYGLYVIIDRNGTWFYYDFNGNLVNSGTWSQGVPSGADAGKASVR